MYVHIFTLTPQQARRDTKSIFKFYWFEFRVYLFLD